MNSVTSNAWDRLEGGSQVVLGNTETFCQHRGANQFHLIQGKSRI